MNTQSKSGIVKPNPKYTLHTQQISPITSNPRVALQDQNWLDAMTIEYNALLK